MIGKNLEYGKYLLKHRFFVLVECFKVGLYWRGLKHDSSKSLPSEWFPYVNFFDSKKRKQIRNKTGYYKPTDTGDTAFDFAWLLHQKRNDHHWQWWILPEDEGGIKVLPMSKDARLEMLCDWCGASKAQGHGGWVGVKEWYVTNNKKMTLHPDTRKFIEDYLGAK